MEGLLFGGAYLRREICISNSIGLALQMEGNLPFLLCFTLYFRAISKYKPAGGMKRWGGGDYIWRGDLTEGFLRYEFGGLIFGGAYFQNFTVLPQKIRVVCISKFATRVFTAKIRVVCISKMTKPKKPLKYHQ